METQRQVKSTSAKLPALLIPSTLTSSRRATWIDIGPLSGRAVEIRGRIVSTPRGVSNRSQQGGGSTPAGHVCWVPMIHPRCCNTRESGEVKSLLETMPVRSQNSCGALNAPEAEIKSAARRRVRKSRGEQARPRHSKTGGSNNFVVRMNDDWSVFTVGVTHAIGSLNGLRKNSSRRKKHTSGAEAPIHFQRLAARVNSCPSQSRLDYGCERILTNCGCLRGRKGAAAIWPSNFFDQRPGTGVRQVGQSPCGVNLYFSIKYP